MSERASLAPSTRGLLRLFPLDFVFNIAIPLLLGQTLVLPHPWRLTAVAAALSLARNAIWVLTLRALLAPVDRWHRSSARDRSDERLREALGAVGRAQNVFVATYGTLWVAAVGVALGFAYVDSGEAVGPGFLTVSALISLTVLLGAGVLTYTFAGALFTEVSLGLVSEAQKRGMSAIRQGTPIGKRIALLAIVIALAPIGWFGGLGLRSAQIAAERAADQSARLELLAAVTHTETQQPGRGDVRVGSVEDLTDAIGEDLSWVRAQKTFTARVEPRNDRAIAVAPAQDGRLLVAIAPVPSDGKLMLLIATLLMAIVVAIWAPISSFTFGSEIAHAIGRVTGAAHRVVEVGDLKAIEDLPVVTDDEIGDLTRHFNELVQDLRDLASAAEKVAGGDLSLDIRRRGDLGAAFGGMLEGLRALVQQIRETSLQLASAAAEIYSASQEQEAAANQQSAGITEVSRTMDSLATSAGHIADSTSTVLDDAERTRVTTDQMATRIAELNAHAGRIGDLLELIREVADRSDLLALNGSLEATRAGESGRGFALVAGEMRRLAERVTATVENVRGMLADVRASGAATVMATDQSRKLAESTTETARRITLVTQQQRTATEQVSASVRDIADVLAQTTAATTQTRVSAEELKTQADRLEELLRRFRVGVEKATTA